MQDKRRKVITGWQLFCLVLNGMVGIGVFSLARQVGDVAGRGALLSIPLAGLVVIFQLIGMNLLASRFPTQTLNEYLVHVLGSFLAKVYLFAYAASAINLGVIVARSYWPLVSAWALESTPQVAFLLPLMLVCWNIAKRGIVVTARMVELINYSGLVLMVVLMLPIVPINPDFLRPVIEQGFGNILRGIAPSVFALAGFDIFLIVFPFARSQRRFWIAVAASSLATFFYTITTLLVLGALGLEFTTKTVWPLQLYLNRFALTAFERADVVFLILWSFQIINVITLTMLTSLSCLQGAFPRIDSRRLALVLLVLALAGVAWPVRFALQTKLTVAAGMGVFFYQGFSPWVLWLVAVLRGKRGVQVDQ